MVPMDKSRSSESRKVYLAVDLGASSGRVMAGVWFDRKLELVEIHRFPVPSEKNGKYLRWDLPAAYVEVLSGLRMAVGKYGEDIVSIGVDTWAVDYGLLDFEGSLLGHPVCYRDDRTNDVMEELSSELSRETIFSETGIQFLPFNTIYQLAAELRDEHSEFKKAKRLLLIPDLLNYWLTGIQATERSNASTTQLLNPVTGDWSKPLLDHLGIDPAILGEVVEPGTTLGPVTSQVAERIGIEAVDVVAVASHDTASAFVALPSVKTNYAILSSGTWSIMGLELAESKLGSNALEAGFSNEIGYGRSVRFLKNTCGLWLIEECRRHWQSEGCDYSYEEIVHMAESVTPLLSFIDPDDALFATPGDMPSRIVTFCGKSGQPVPETHAEIVRCVFDSLAMKCRFVFNKLSQFSPAPLEGLYVLGGGSRNDMLNQIISNALNVPVLAGPAEATAIGNIVVQMIAKGELADLAEARNVIGQSFGTKPFLSKNSEMFAEARNRFELLLKNHFNQTKVVADD